MTTPLVFHSPQCHGAPVPSAAPMYPVQALALEPRCAVALHHLAVVQKDLGKYAVPQPPQQIQHARSAFAALDH